MLKKIFKILGKRRGAIYVAITVLALIGAMIDTVLTYVVLPFVSMIVAPETLDGSKLELILKEADLTGQGEEICFLAIAIALAYIIRNVYMLGITFFRCKFIASCKSYVSTKLFEAISNRPYAFFTATNTSSIQKICINDVTRLFSVLDATLNIFTGFITSLLIVVVLFITEPMLTLISVAVVMLMTVFVNKPIARKASHLSRDYSYHYTKMLQWTQQFVGCTKAIIANKKQSYFRNKYAYHNVRFTKNEGKYSAIANLTGYIMNAVIMGLVFLYIAVLAGSGTNINEKIPVLALFAMAALKIMPCVANLTSLINNIKYNEEGVDIIYSQVDGLDREITEEYRTSLEKMRVEDALKEGITLEGVTFRYEDSERTIFENLNLKIPANESVAFIGTTGSGKTTLADIILGLQKPLSGKVTVDGKDIDENRIWWADQIGYIPQSIYLCEESIRSNIAFGVPEEEIDDGKVAECMKKAQIYEFVQTLPQKENTITGENGVKLSGGQRQRIGIARALYHDPPFLVFDEATSALDGETEKAIIDTVNSFAGKKTMLIIAHRMSTIKKCSIVYRIENGHVDREK
jgi:ABC-type multidrug transport system, ATPase and permease components